MKKLFLLLLSCIISMSFFDNDEKWKKLKGGRYKGAFLHGVPNGKGVFLFDNGTSYEGSFVDGYFHGEGTLKLSDVTFLGNFEKGKFIKGLASYKTGIIYSGEMSDLKWHGKGELIQNNVTYTGDFENGAIIKGTAYYKDGKVYSGQFKGFIPDGQGLMYFPDKSYHAGIFKNAEQIGNGERYDSKTKILSKGNFENGTLMGEGFLVDEYNNVNLVYLDRFGNNIINSVLQESAEKAVDKIEMTEMYELEKKIESIKSESNSKIDKLSNILKYENDSLRKNLANQIIKECHSWRISLNKDYLDDITKEDTDFPSGEMILSFNERYPENGINLRFYVFNQLTILTMERPDETEEEKRVREEKSRKWDEERKLRLSRLLPKCIDMMREYNDNVTDLDNLKKKIENTKNEMELIKRQSDETIRIINKEAKHKMEMLRKQREQEELRKLEESKRRKEAVQKKNETDRNKDCGSVPNVCMSGCLRFMEGPPCKGCVCQM